MNAVSRQFSKIGFSGQNNIRNPGDNARVSVLLSDFEDADKVLAAIIDNAKLWRDSWFQMLSTQHGTVAEYEKLYDPIVGTSDGHGRELESTPELQLNRTFRLREMYDELKTELTQEIAQIEARVLQPAIDARDLIMPIKKTIKRREHKRQDYEKSIDKVLKLQRKMGKTAKEDASLAKSEAESERLQEDFLAADSHLRETLPGTIEAAFSILPLLIDAIVLVQNTLLGLYYTYLNRFCEEHEFPSPPPPMEDVISVWSAAYRPAKQQVESITIIARGKGMRATLKLGDEAAHPQPQTKTSFSLRGGFKRTPTQPSVHEPEEEKEEAPVKPPRPNTRIPSAPSLHKSPVSSRPPLGANRSAAVTLPDYSGPHGYVTPTAFTTATSLGRSSAHLSPNTGRPEYLSRPSSSSTIGSAASSGFAAAAAKKKPPPPPPPKKKLQMPRFEFMVALYPFQGQGQGDLSFQEGDRIKILEKTETDQDWWVGELKGVKGNFPANYCRKE